jgi:hypothetical protein
MTNGKDKNDNKISTANVDVSAMELLDDHHVVARGMVLSTPIIQNFTFAIILQLQNTVFDKNRPNADIFSKIHRW